MKIKTLKEVRYDMKKKLIRVREKSGGLWLIDGELYDVDSLHDTFLGDSRLGQGSWRGIEDPEHTYQDNFFANAGDLLTIVRTNKGWAVVRMEFDDGEPYEMDPDGYRTDVEPYAIIPHNQFEIGLDRFFDEENKRIVEVEFPKIRQRIVSRLPRQWNSMQTGKPSVLRNPKVRHHGTGAFASTYSHKDRPEDVRKITKPSGFADGYHKYIELLKDNPDFDNPYFPKIREITRYKSSNEKQGPGSEINQKVLSVKKEVLRHMDELTYKEVVSILERWFGPQWNDIIKQIVNLNVSTLKTWPRYDTLLSSLIRKIADFPEDFRGKLRDKQLYDALYWLRHTVVKSGTTFDMGINNIMYKRSPYGIQLVLTDPVA